MAISGTFIRMKKFLFIFFIILISFNFSIQAWAFNPFEWIRISSGNSNYSAQEQRIRDALDNLVSAYESRSITDFMDYVSEDFTQDPDIFETRIRNDFSQYSFIRINYIVNSIIPNSKKDKYAVSINFVLQREYRRTAKMTSRTGTATLIFNDENGSLKIYSTSGTPLFGS